VRKKKERKYKEGKGARRTSSRILFYYGLIDGKEGRGCV
jgi:hypothetical protein